MKPIFRRTLPPSVRSLLTDIGPKDEWPDEEEDASAVSRDGILLPERGSSFGNEGFISRAQADGKNTKVCMLCNCKPACYTCPRCNLHYCGVACYRSPDHSLCSEDFYKESVLEELKNMGETDQEGKKKMQEILLSLRQKAQMTNGGIESVFREAGIEQDTDIKAVDLLSRLAELQEFEADSVEEIEDILKTLEGIGEDEADEEPSGSVARQLSELDLDKLSEEELWALLDSREKEKFTGLLRGGALGGLIPVWRPWWEEHEEEGKALVEVLKQEVQKPDKKVKKTQDKNKTSIVCGVPAISAKIPKLNSLCRNPSPLVCYSVINTLYCYAFTLQLFNGDPDSLPFEFCDMMLTLSEGLSSGKVFNSVQEAVHSGETLILGGGYLNKQESRATDLAVEATAHILTGRDEENATVYILAALSQLRSALTRARAALSKEGEGGAKRQKYFLASKKCEFFQAWTLDRSLHTRGLALELWNEHSRREADRESVEETKMLVEESFKKGKRKGHTKMIQELN
ncbi:zinc finger HIT domain-containing protein 2 [Syngnathoides biaculeatus]|uniref:zinc finger HIT domain-containing protein 2 n=1 Tax=Syngnathoides biaculeatus TaxID=300417 RepID=UPI002ADD6E9E|nr:zinc finger HIT domain-containing protein 2 [Syngnathoides biaculeatus]